MHFKVLVCNSYLFSIRISIFDRQKKSALLFGKVVLEHAKCPFCIDTSLLEQEARGISGAVP